MRGIANLGLDMVLIWALTSMTESTLKLIVRRARPMPRTKAALPGDTFSFPSGHTMRGFYYYVPYLFGSRFVAAAFGEPFAFLPTWALPLALTAAALTGFSRVARLRHWPTDCLAGGLLGAVGGYFFEAASQAGVRVPVFRVSVAWALGIAALQHCAAARRVFGTTVADESWTLFAVLAGACLWLYEDPSVQGGIA